LRREQLKCWMIIRILIILSKSRIREVFKMIVNKPCSNFKPSYKFKLLSQTNQKVMNSMNN